LNPEFVRTYLLGDELGSGGYGFVMTARHRTEGHEVAVKFIIKEKVPDHAWMENDAIGRLPTEVILLSFIDHENIVKCLDLFEDSLYFYLVR
jgi:PAS domain-containing serine/threonine kinase